MTQQIINVGTGPDSYTGESLRSAFQKVNENFSQLYAGNVGANISGNIVTANGFVTSGNITAGNVTVAGNISAYYFTGNGALLTGITASANTGSIAFNGLTMSGTVNGNIVLDPSGDGNVNIPSNLRTEGLRVGTINDTELAVSISSNTASITTAGRANGNISLSLSANNNKGRINIRADNGHMGFGMPADGYDYIFNGEIKANAFYADANFPVGYQFTTPGGDTGLSHDYDTTQGNISVVKIRHDSAEVVKFYENLTTIMSGNLVVSQTGNVFGSFPNAYVQAYSNINSYSQLVLQNTNNGPLASFDLVATADNGNDSAYYGDFGVASSTYDYLGFGIIKPNDVYLLAVGTNITGPGSVGKANLILGSTNGNIKMFVGAPESANLIAEVNSTSFLPGANVTYNLGSSTRQWKDLWLSNSTLYLGGTPITVANGVLSVNGSVVSGNYSNANVAAYLPVYSGNVSANNFIGNIQGNIQGLIGSITNLDSGNFTVENISARIAENGVNIGAGGYNNLLVLPTDVIIQNVPLTVAGNILSTVAGGLYITANTVANGTARIWNFGTDGRLTFPGTPRIDTGSNNFEVQAAESVNLEANAAVNIYTDTSGGAYQWQFDTAGDLTVPGSIFVPSGASISGTGSPAPRMSGFSSIEAASLYSGTGNVTVRASYGNLRIGDVGNVGSSNAGVTSSTTFSIVTDNLATPHEWVFDANGILTAPGDITATSGNILVKNIRTTDGTVYVGQGAGLINQGTYGIAVGRFAGSQDQGGAGVAVGQLAGQISQGVSAVAIGLYAAANTQSANAVAVGTFAGRNNQGTSAVAIGVLAGNSSQGAAAIAIGEQAGNITQGSQSIAIGTVAGQSNQGTDAIAIGTSAGGFNQREGAVAIGQSAGVIDQGMFAVAIGSGAGYQYQANNSIAITATGTQLSPTESGFYIDPVRSADGSNVSLSYNTSTREITYSANTFVSNTYVPGSAGSAGTIGQISFDGSYVYVCVATNTWKRANLSTW